MMPAAGNSPRGQVGESCYKPSGIKALAPSVYTKSLGGRGEVTGTPEMVQLCILDSMLPSETPTPSGGRKLQEVMPEGAQLME